MGIGLRLQKTHPLDGDIMQIPGSFQRSEDSFKLNDEPVEQRFQTRAGILECFTLLFDNLLRGFAP